MRKKMAALMMAAVMIVLSAVPTLAYVKDPRYSPTGSVITETRPPTSPKTGESDALLYGVGAAAVCGTVMIVSGRKLKKS